MHIESRAPTRIDLAGGTLDIWPLYLYHQPAVTVNVAIELHAACRLTPRRDRKIVLLSYDTRTREIFGLLKELAAAKNHHLALPALLVRAFRPQNGLVLETDSEAPAGAGLGGSSALNIAICGALNEFTRAGYSTAQRIVIARNVEAQVIRIPTGEQDYFSATYGGVSAIHWRPEGPLRVGIPLNLAELQERLVLVYTGEPRASAINNWQVMKAHIDGSRRVLRNFDELARIALEMHQALAEQDWREVGRLLHSEWQVRRRNAPGISTPFIDRLWPVARRAGAVASKVCGAGGGGCVVYFVEKGTRARVEQALGQAGARVIPVRIARRGLRLTRG